MANKPKDKKESPQLSLDLKPGPNQETQSLATEKKPDITPVRYIDSRHDIYQKILNREMK